MMNTDYLKKNKLNFIILAVAIVFFTTAFFFWRDYLQNHFAGTFDEYGLPSKFFRTGWPLLFDVWPLWFIPALFIILFIQGLEWLIRKFVESKNNEAIQQTTTDNHIKSKSHTEFNRALEIEELKQQVDILKHKYFEAHRKAQEIIRNTEEADLALQLAQKEAADAKTALAAVNKKIQPSPATQTSSAHHEATITTLKAENKKLQKKITDLQEDLEQSNALIEKLLETQAG